MAYDIDLESRGFSLAGRKWDPRKIDSPLLEVWRHHAGRYTIGCLSTSEVTRWWLFKAVEEHKMVATAMHQDLAKILEAFAHEN